MQWESPRERCGRAAASRQQGSQRKIALYRSRATSVWASRRPATTRVPFFGAREKHRQNLALEKARRHRHSEWTARRRAALAEKKTQTPPRVRSLKRATAAFSCLCALLFGAHVTHSCRVKHCPAPSNATATASPREDSCALAFHADVMLVVTSNAERALERGAELVKMAQQTFSAMPVIRRKLAKESRFLIALQLLGEGDRTSAIVQDQLFRSGRSNTASSTKTTPSRARMKSPWYDHIDTHAEAVESSLSLEGVQRPNEEATDLELQQFARPPSRKKRAHRPISRARCRDGTRPSPIFLGR